MPSVTTNAVTNITDTSATCGGEVTSDGGSTVTARGVCWSTSTRPTINDPHTDDGMGTGTFTSHITNLEGGTIYYIRAYATNSAGTSYGSQTTVTTSSLPIVTTSIATSILSTYAACGGNVISDDGTSIISRGLCYSTTSNPTIADSIIPATSNDTGVFSCSITGLTEGTRYYVRAYATNSLGTSYGSQIYFTTIPEGGLFSLFSVSPYLQVRFAHGNLQWSAKNGGNVATTHTVAGGGTAAGTWRFATNQYDTIGADNSNASYSYSGWIDLFGWGTSGYNGMPPYMTSIVNSDYGTADISETNYDWGVYNAISNGGNRPGQWRTLTNSEWAYMLQGRPNASSKYGIACVNGVNGLVILPDAWSLPNGLTFTSGTHTISAPQYFAQQNNYTADQWLSMESQGAIFLPAAGYRNGDIVTYMNTCGLYWSSTYLNGYRGFYLFFNSNTLYPSNYDFCSDGRAIRLVQDF